MYGAGRAGQHRVMTSAAALSATAGFDVEAFLARPLTARLATVTPAGPVVRPVWFLWEEAAFWTLTGPWARLHQQTAADPRVAVVVDECDLATGRVRQVIARGRAELVPFDVPRGRRKLSRYLGADESRWATRFSRYLYTDPAESGAVWLRLAAARLSAQDLSYTVEP